MPGPYLNRRVVLLTQHGKERIIGPVLQMATGCVVRRIAGYDTDLLGTFARDVAREGTQLEAARRKARIGMELGKSALGLASEGAVVPDPFAGIIPWNVELVVFIDDIERFEVAGIAQGPARRSHRSVHDADELRTFAEEGHFPDHHLMLRPNDEHDPRIQEGIASWSALMQAFQRAQACSHSGRVFVEHDFRASCNPTRRLMIRAASEDLARKLSSYCPACDAPGFCVSGYVEGLPCRLCGTPTREPMSEIVSCVRCDYRRERERKEASYADPSRCDFCNP